MAGQAELEGLQRLLRRIERVQPYDVGAGGSPVGPLSPARQRGSNDQRDQAPLNAGADAATPIREAAPLSDARSLITTSLIGAVLAATVVSVTVSVFLLGEAKKSFNRDATPSNRSELTAYESLRTKTAEPESVPAAGGSALPEKGPASSEELPLVQPSEPASDSADISSAQGVVSVETPGDLTAPDITRIESAANIVSGAKSGGPAHAGLPVADAMALSAEPRQGQQTLPVTAEPQYASQSSGESSLPVIASQKAAADLGMAKSERQAAPDLTLPVVVPAVDVGVLEQPEPVASVPSPAQSAADGAKGDLAGSVPQMAPPASYRPSEAVSLGESGSATPPQTEPHGNPPLDSQSIASAAVNGATDESDPNQTLPDSPLEIEPYWVAASGTAVPLPVRISPAFANQDHQVLVSGFEAGASIEGGIEIVNGTWLFDAETMTEAKLERGPEPPDHLDIEIVLRTRQGKVIERRRIELQDEVPTLIPRG